ncbi:hypothetical protein IQ255_05110 [Pleurocapsales cyanobacterium LEGE 10410]|nr:hypothetical protein [Pleurocapsales cyanobacterium LEGE 10410]
MKKTNFIVNIFQNIKHSLLVNKSEPHIQQKRDRLGNSYWQVHDYKTNRFYTFGCDREVRAWLEERYHTI